MQEKHLKFVHPARPGEPCGNHNKAFHLVDQFIEFEPIIGPQNSMDSSNDSNHCSNSSNLHISGHWCITRTRGKNYMGRALRNVL